MPKLQRTTDFKDGILINENGKALFIKQPNIMEIAMLYQAIMENIKMISTVFNSQHEFLE